METMFQLEITGLNNITAEGTTSMVHMAHSNENLFLITKRNNTGSRNSLFFNYEPTKYFLLHSPDNGSAWNRTQLMDAPSAYPDIALAKGDFLIIYSRWNQFLYYLDYTVTDEKQVRTRFVKQFWNADDYGNIYYRDAENKYYSFNLKSEILTEVKGPPFVPNFLYYLNSDSAWAGVSWISYNYQKSTEFWRYSTDNEDWQLIKTVPGKLQQMEISGTTAIYGVTDLGNSAEIIFSEDDGISWSNAVLPTKTGHFIPAADGLWVWKADDGIFFLSSDRGISWLKKEISGITREMHFRSIDDIYYEKNNTIFKTDQNISESVAFLDLNEGDPYSYVRDVYIDFFDCFFISVMTSPSSSEGDNNE
jgi:hypothetical protein